jgi:hypothetical protein
MVFQVMSNRDSPNHAKRIGFLAGGSGRAEGDDLVCEVGEVDDGGRRHGAYGARRGGRWRGWSVRG